MEKMDLTIFTNEDKKVMSEHFQITIEKLESAIGAITKSQNTGISAIELIGPSMDSISLLVFVIDSHTMKSKGENLSEILKEPKRVIKKHTLRLN
jgi:Flp pilus assembly protein TadB